MALTVNSKNPRETFKSAYKACKLKCFFLSNGTKISPQNGVFYPKTEEEVQELKYFASRNLDLVEILS